MTKVEFSFHYYDKSGRRNKITIPSEARCLFPSYKGSFELQSRAGTDTVTDTVTVWGNPGSEDPHIHLTLTEWFKGNKNPPKEGDKIIIEITETKQGKVYFLR